MGRVRLTLPIRGASLVAVLSTGGMAAALLLREYATRPPPRTLPTVEREVHKGLDLGPKPLHALFYPDIAGIAGMTENARPPEA